MTDAPTQLLINGELRDAASGRTLATFETKAVLQGTSPKPMNPFGI